MDIDQVTIKIAEMKARVVISSMLTKVP